MDKKYFNDAIIGNEFMKASFTKKGELLRLCYPMADYKQYIFMMILIMNIFRII